MFIYTDSLAFEKSKTILALAIGIMEISFAQTTLDIWGIKMVATMTIRGQYFRGSHIKPLDSKMSLAGLKQLSGQSSILII